MSGLPPCPVCSAAGPSLAFALQHGLLRCGACGLLYSERVAGADLVGYYASDPEGFFDSAYFDASGQDASHPEAANYRDALSRLRAAAGPGRLLDVGCGNGALLRAAAALGFAAEGLEVSAKAAARAGGFPVRVYDGDLPRLPPCGPYDAVVLWDVLEHLGDPVGSLRALRGCLKPGGRLLVRTIDEDCLLAAASLALTRLGVDAAARRMHEVYHVVYFTRRSLDDCLRRAGFAPESRWDGEFPVERASRSRVVRVLLRGAYALQGLFGRRFEQYVIARA